LERKGFNIDRRKLQLDEPLKALGEFNVSVKLHRDVSVPVKVKIHKEAGEETPAAEEANAEA